jgi:hypothetical protein
MWLRNSTFLLFLLTAVLLAWAILRIVLRSG